MALVSYFIALMIGLVGVSYLIAVVAFKTAFYFMSGGNDDNN
jgi:hypothetical protein